MIHPTSYLSPEECALGEGLRILSDDRFYWPPEPLPAEQLFEIERALQMRIQRKRTARRLLYVLWFVLLIRSTLRSNPREVYAIRLWYYLAANNASWLSFRGCMECYNIRQAIFKGEL